MTSEESADVRIWKRIDKLKRDFRHSVYGAISQQVGIEIKRVGESALPVLLQALEDQDETVRRIAVSLLRFVDELPLEALFQALSDPEAKVRRVVTRELRYMAEHDESVLDPLGRALEDPDTEVRQNAFYGLWLIGKPALPLLARALEDPDSANVRIVIREYSQPDIDAGDIAEAIINELIIRASGQPSERFNYEVVALGLQSLITRNPRLHGQVISRLRDLAYECDSEVRQRAIAVARELDPDEFAMLVRTRAEEDPDRAAVIMRLLGGSEALAFFSPEQSRALKRFREPLEDLEKISRDRWEGLTIQTRRGYYINMGLSIALFVMGAVIVIWGLCLLTQSDDLAKQITGGVVAGLSGLATTFSSRFWKEPVEHIKSFSAQQARLQAAFIGYMNRVAQVRLVFEHNYAMGELTLTDLEEYQRMLSEAIDQAARQLGSEIHVPTL
jgi:hypothetical protein